MLWFFTYLVIPNSCKFMIERINLPNFTFLNPKNEDKNSSRDF